jgi:Uncharacterised protein family (UPF0153).
MTHQRIHNYDPRVRHPEERVRHPEHEARHPWLTRLLRAYHLSDVSTRLHLDRETARRGVRVACAQGCHTCCVGQHIPVSAFEALGLWWYAAELLPVHLRHSLRGNIARHDAEHHESTTACAFLVEGACSVYPVRPFVCRQHHTFGTPCQPGENIHETRPGDLFRYSNEAAREISWQLLPLYGVAEEDIDRLYENGYISRKGRLLHTLPLEHLLTHMDTAAAHRNRHHA